MISSECAFKLKPTGFHNTAKYLVCSRRLARRFYRLVVKTRIKKWKALGRMVIRSAHSDVNRSNDTLNHIGDGSIRAPGLPLNVRPQKVFFG
jgi:hypothetical protein